MAGTSIDNNDAELNGEKPEKKNVKKALLSKLPRLKTLKRKKTEETSPTSNGAGPQSQGSQSSAVSTIGKAVASHGNMLAKVISNDTGYVANVDMSPYHEPGIIYASPGPMSAASDASSAPWSSQGGSRNDTGITTPGSSMSGKCKLPVRAGVLPSPDSSNVLPNDRRPSVARSITWNAETESAGQDSADKAASSETNLIDSNALTRVVTFHNDTHFGPSARSMSCQYYERSDIKKSVTPWTDDPKWKLSQKAQEHQKAVLAADPDSLPIVTKVRSAPEKPSSKIPLSKKKRISSSGKNFVANKKKEAMRMTDKATGKAQSSKDATATSKALNAKAESSLGKLKRALPLPKDPEPVPELKPLVDPGYDKWSEKTRAEKVKQSREMMSNMSSFNLSAALNRSQPEAEITPGPFGETPYSNEPSQQLHDDFPTKHDILSQFDAANLASALPAAGDISPRMVPATLPAAVEAVEEEEVIEELSSSSSSSSGSDSDSSTEPDSDSSAQNNSTQATRNRKLSKSNQNDSARPSVKHSLNRPIPYHSRSGSIDLDLLQSKLVKAGQYEMKLSSSIRPSATPPNAGLCGMSKLEMYRSNEDHGMCNGFESCAMSRKSASSTSLKEMRGAEMMKEQA